MPKEDGISKWLRRTFEPHLREISGDLHERVATKFFFQFELKNLLHIWSVWLRPHRSNKEMKQLMNSVLSGMRGGIF